MTSNCEVRAEKEPPEDVLFRIAPHTGLLLPNSQPHRFDIGLRVVIHADGIIHGPRAARTGSGGDTWT
jgi:hypothetical protein